MTAALPAEIQAVFEAVGRGDTEAFLAEFAPNLGVVDDWGRTFHGRDAIRQWSDAELIGKRVTLAVVHFYATGEGETVVIAQVGSSGVTRPATLTFRVDDHKIAQMRITA